MQYAWSRLQAYLAAILAQITSSGPTPPCQEHYLAVFTRALDLGQALIMRTPATYVRPVDDNAAEYASQSDTSLERNSLLEQRPTAIHVEHVETQTKAVMSPSKEPSITVPRLDQASHAVWILSITTGSEPFGKHHSSGTRFHGLLFN